MYRLSRKALNEETQRQTKGHHSTKGYQIIHGRRGRVEAIRCPHVQAGYQRIKRTKRLYLSLVSGEQQMTSALVGIAIAAIIMTAVLTLYNRYFSIKLDKPTATVQRQ